MIYIGLDDNKTIEMDDPEMEQIDISKNDVIFTISSIYYTYDFRISYFSTTNKFNIQKTTKKAEREIREINIFIANGRYYFNTGENKVYIRYLDVGILGLVII